MRTPAIAFTTCLTLFLSGMALPETSTGTSPGRAWDSKAAAAYLDQRAAWWMDWPAAARDHETFCVSCHTAVPYALGRPALRAPLAENGPSVNERRLLANVIKRVALWNEVKPFYSDEQRGAPKTAESRGTEAVLNALILASYDARDRTLDGSAREALANMWAAQLKTGSAKGAFMWLNFHNEPWEADDSQYWGATLAALAAGAAPDNYVSSFAIRDNVAMLAAYLREGAPRQSPLNRAWLLWASASVPGLLSPAGRTALIGEFYAKQRDDGGWSATSLVIDGWKRHDATPLETASDGYATGLVAVALERAGISRSEPRLGKALAWLAGNQDRTIGLWPAWSLNKRRDPASDIGRFMTDAATAYSVLALEPAN